MLSKQSIRKEHTIYLNDVLMTKEEIIEISKDFNEKEEQHFRKMLQQGGSLKIKGNKFKIDNTSINKEIVKTNLRKQLNLIEQKIGNETFRRHTMVDL